MSELNFELKDKYPEFFKPYYLGLANTLSSNHPALPECYEQFITTGVDFTYSWSVDYTLAKFSVAVLKNYAENSIGVPSCIPPLDDYPKAEQRWKRIINKIITNLSLYHSEDYDYSNNADKKREAGFRILFKYLHSIWY